MVPKEDVFNQYLHFMLHTCKKRVFRGFELEVSHLNLYLNNIQKQLHLNLLLRKGLFSKRAVGKDLFYSFRTKNWDQTNS